MELVKASSESKVDHKGRRCPNCGRRYAEVFWKPNAKLPTFRCVCIGHGGGCGHEWEER